MEKEPRSSNYGCSNQEGHDSNLNSCSPLPSLLNTGMAVSDGNRPSKCKVQLSPLSQKEKKKEEEKERQDDVVEKKVGDKKTN